MEGLDLNPDLLSKSGLSQVTQLTSVSSSVIGIIIAALKGLVVRQQNNESERIFYIWLCLKIKLLCFSTCMFTLI